MAKAILMPQVGQDLTHGKVIEIKVALGDIVKRGDIVAVVESEKATFDVEAFDEGEVLALPYAEGDEAEVLKPLIYVGKPGDVIGNEQTGTAAGPAAVVATISKAAYNGAAGGRGSSPLARRLAAKNGIDLGKIIGTGPGAAIVKRDVEQALKNGASFTAPVVDIKRSYSAEGSLHIRTLRSGAGLPVVFFHGFGGDLSAWRQIAGQIDLPNPLVALDLPGHGASPLPGGRLDIESLAVAVDRGLTSAGIEEAHFVGHSLGAAVAATLAASGLRHAPSMTLIAPAGLGKAISHDFLEAFTKAADEVSLKVAMLHLVSDASLLTPTLVRATFATREEKRLVAGQAQLKEALFAGGLQGFSIAHGLQRYAGALRVILGSNDNVIPWRELPDLPGSAALHRLAGTGHMPQLEATALVARLIAATVKGS
jgi:pimeloyl-ACP methyl ester carboxylesterase